MQSQKINNKKIFLDRWDQSGFSLVSILVAVAIGGFLALGVSSVMTQVVMHSKEIDLDTELSRIRSIIAGKIDCKATLDTARSNLGIGSNDVLCNATKSSSAAVAGYDLTNAYPLQLILKAANSTNRTFMGTVSNSQKEALLGGGWYAQVGCDWGAKTLVVRVRRKLQNAPDPNKNPPSLLFGDEGLAPPICRKELIPPSQTPPPPNPREQMSEVAYFDTKDESYFEFEVDSTFKIVELNIRGEWEGVHDSGADVYSEQVFINLASNTFSGAQMVKIGSDQKRSRTALWRDTWLHDSKTTAPLSLMKNGVCQFGDAADYGTCAPNPSWGNKKFPIPHLTCLNRQSGRCVKLRYEAHLVSGDDSDKDWWASTVVIRKFK